MSKYERIRQEIIAIERELAALRGSVRDARDREAFDQICQKNERIRSAFTTVRPAI